ncbi:MAG TPA: DUF1801 domain-containing protein [Candidatus Angelobacter sp.]|nr:DUF1801 domain-containing protein [Candidatus Angelobacter sp.]
MKQAKNVEEYIATAPIAVQSKLRQVRAAIRAVAPDAVESISYGMPFYSYKGEAGFKGRLVYFGLLKASIALYMRPQDIEPYVTEASEYKSTKSALQFPLDQEIPVSLVQKLVRQAMKTHYAGEQKTSTRAKKPVPVKSSD